MAAPGLACDCQLSRDESLKQTPEMTLITVKLCTFRFFNSILSTFFLVAYKLHIASPSLWRIQVIRLLYINFFVTTNNDSISAQEIASVIDTLTKGSPQQQEDALNTYFLPNASFIHPFCRVPSFSQGSIPLASDLDSRWLILGIYRWYRTLSPRIDLTVDSAGTSS